MTRYASTMLLLSVIAAAVCDAADRGVEGQDALTKLQDYVGQWRGVGQLRRGSTRGAWTEECGWAWKFGEGKASLTFSINDAKYFGHGVLRAALDTGEYELLASSKDEPPVAYAGAVDDDGTLVLTADDAPDGKPARISIRQVADGKRMLVLYEQRRGSTFIRMSEVGYTREGSNFGKGTNYVECVVTGGVGTIAVNHNGKTYYVCCTGCRDYFNEDPEAALAEYRVRKEEEQKKQQPN